METAREKRTRTLSTRTLDAVKDRLRAQALGCQRSESDMLHIVLCQVYGLDPLTGEPLPANPGPGADPVEG